MQANFASVVVAPERVRCIGVDMLPYTLGHHMRLIAAESPFVTGQGFPGYEELKEAAFICAHTWQELETMPPWQAWLRGKVWGLLAGKFDVAQAILVMKLHVMRGAELPPDDKGESRSVRHLFSDWETRVYTFLRRSGFSHIEAMDTPLVRANLMFCAEEEVAGRMLLLSKRRQAIHDKVSDVLEKLESGEIALPA